MNAQCIVIVGSTGSGKTTLAHLLAGRLDCPHVELDALHWEPNWAPAQPDIFRQRVGSALDRESWIADGNYSKVRDIVWDQAELLIWLDYGLPLLIGRLMRRTTRRIVRREILWSNNRETWRALLGRDSLLMWLLTSFRRRRREYPVLLASPPYAHLTVVRLQSPRALQQWLAKQGLDGSSNR